MIKPTGMELCSRCGRELDPNKIKWLELSFKTGKWNNPEIKQLDESESQGCFPFGQACAVAQLKEQQ